MIDDIIREMTYEKLENIEYFNYLVDYFIDANFDGDFQMPHYKSSIF